MRTRSSSYFPVVSSNPSTSNPKRRNRRRSKQPYTLEESPIDTMADQRTMAKLLRAPTEGYAEEIVVPPILAEKFKLKHSLINMMNTDQFFGLEKDNPHDHICWGSPRWLKKEPPRSFHTWEDLVSKLINEFFPPSRTTNLRNEILNFQQRFDEYFHEAWDRYKDLLRAFPHHGFTELHQLDSFYNALNPADQDSLNAAAGGNLLERRTQDVLTIIKNKSKVSNSQSKLVVSQVKSFVVNSNSSSEISKLTHAVNQQTSVVTTAMTTMLKQFQATPPLASIKVVEETCVTCGAAVNYNQGNPGYHPPGMANQIRTPGFAQQKVQNNQNLGSPQGFNRGNNFNHEKSYQALAQQNQNAHLNELEKVRRMNEANMKAMQTQIDMVKNELRNEMKNSIQTSLSNLTNEIKYMMASLLQMNTASSSGTGSLPSNTVANPKGELKAITTRSGLVIDGPTIPTPPQSINLEVDERIEETFTDSDLMEYTIKVPPPPVQKYKPLSQREYVKMLKAHLSNKEKLQELANTPFNENCSTVILKRLPEKLADPGKFLILCRFSELKCKSLADLANRAICTPAGIARDIFIPVGKFTFPANFVIVDYESDLRVPLILRRPFLRTARALIDVHGEEMILYDEGCNVLSEKLLDLDSTKDLHPPLFDNLLSGSTTYFSSSNPLLEEFVDELPPKYNDNLQFDIESNLKEIEFLLYQDKDSSLKDSMIKRILLILLTFLLILYLIYVESDAENVYDDHFDSKGEKIKESKLLIDELDLPCDFLPPFEYDSFISQDFSRVDALPLTNNEDKIFNPCILIQEKPIEIITLVVQDKKLEISNASLVLEDFDPPFYEPLFFKEVPKSKMLLPFSSKMRKKFLNQGYTLLKKFILLLSQNYLVKAMKFSKSTRFSKA
nr:hypothetical protein [Tanacetum cinerariifolium]